MHSNLTLVLEIAFVPHYHDRIRILILDSEDLLVEGNDLLEGFPRSDRVHNEESMPMSHPLLA
jgi:hypothetical protein